MHRSLASGTSNRGIWHHSQAQTELACKQEVITHSSPASALLNPANRSSSVMPPMYLSLKKICGTVARPVSCWIPARNSGYCDRLISTQRIALLVVPSEVPPLVLCTAMSVFARWQCLQPSVEKTVIRPIQFGCEVDTAQLYVVPDCSARRTTGTHWGIWVDRLQEQYELGFFLVPRSGLFRTTVAWYTWDGLVCTKRMCSPRGTAGKGRGGGWRDRFRRRFVTQLCVINEDESSFFFFFFLRRVIW